MIRRNAALTVTAAFLIVGAVGIHLGWFAPSPLLTVHLRCNEPAAGRLFLSILSDTGPPRSGNNIDVKTACGTGKVELERYRREQDLRVRIEVSDGSTSEIIARYGSDIQSDRDGYFTVIRITSAPPFLANDRI